MLMLSCKKATELVEKKHTFGLNRVEGFRLWLHLKMCDACHAYAQQTILISNAMKKFMLKDQPQDLKDLKLTDEFKEKLAKQMEQEN